MTGEKREQNGGPPNPSVPKDSLRPPLQKRFYATVAIAEKDGGFAVTLDGRGIKTPAKRALVAPSREIAEAVAAEWDAQSAHIDPSTMPVTRLLNSAIDGVADRKAEVARHIASFAGNDLLCYRADAPTGLVCRQSEAWDPLLAWARESLGADLRTSTGLMPVEQPEAATAAVERALAHLDPLSLAALHVMTTISGSAILALAHARGIIDLDTAWAAATVDEAWQTEQWGRDAEADAVAARRFEDFAAASRCVRRLESRR